MRALRVLLLGCGLAWMPIVYCTVPETFSPDTALVSKALYIKWHHGFIIPHSEDIRSISLSSPRGLELDFSWHYRGQTAWEYCYCFPRLGVVYQWIDFDNPEILGHAHTFATYIEPFFNASRQFNTSFRMLAGITYGSNKYDPENNPLNLFYSTDISFMLGLSYSLNLRLTPRVLTRLSFNYNHISNGGVKDPNKGVNFPTLAGGVEYIFNPGPFPGRERPLNRQPAQSGWKGNLAVSATGQTARRNDKTRYPVYSITAYTSRQLGRLSGIMTGAEWIADMALRERLNSEGNTGVSHHRAGLLLGHELLIGRFTAGTHLGVYVYTPAKAKDPVYQRYNLEFRITPSLFAGVSLKAHRHIADFLDFRFGYRFW
jgi:hypothetical protein